MNTSSLSSSSLMNQVPTELFSSKSLFRSVVNYDLWKNHLGDAKKAELLEKHLPPELSQEEKEETVKLLLGNSLTRFGDNPMDYIYFQLKIQRQSPDLIKAMEDVKQLNLKAQRLQEQQNQCKLFHDVINKRKALLEDAVNSPPDCIIRSSKHLKSGTIEEPADLEKKQLWHKVKERYVRELRDSGLDPNADCNKSSEDDDDVQSPNEAKPFPFSPFSTISPTLSLCSPSLYTIPERSYVRMLKKHKKKRLKMEESELDDPRMNVSDITLSSVIQRVSKASEEEKDILVPTAMVDIKMASPIISNKLPKMSPSSTTSSVVAVKKPVKSATVSKPAVVPVEPEKKAESEESTEIKKETKDVFDFEDDSPPQAYPPPPLTLTSSSVTPTPPVTTFSTIIPQPQSPIIAAPLPALPPLLPSTPEPPPLPPVPLEKPPRCFFSLLRDTFYTHAPNDHKLTLHKLEELVKEKLRCYDPKLGWSHEMVQSAMNYLSGVLPPPEMVPLVDYKEKNQQWQWIGHGRDDDDVVDGLCKEWNEEKDKNMSTSLMDPSQPVPPALCPTEWIVKPSNEDERRSYREQEALRYNNPHKAFTFRVHSYESVVGPVKGCGIGSGTAHSSSPNKAREHSLLVSDRPPFVTLLSLVRDAAARLPNGEGTRADICELLKDSQYLLPTVSDQQVNGIVSGALDRLHYEKDPCVKYDVNRKVWIYLHRNRPEYEFERLHEMQVAAAKAKRSLSKAQRRSSSTSSSTKSSSGIGGKSSTKGAKVSSSSPVQEIPGPSGMTATATTTVAVTVASQQVNPPLAVCTASSVAAGTTLASTAPTPSVSTITQTISNLISSTTSNDSASSTISVLAESLSSTKPAVPSILPIISKKPKPSKPKILKRPSEEKTEAGEAVVPSSASTTTLQTVACVPSVAIATLPVTTFPKVDSIDSSSITSGITSIVATKSLPMKPKQIRQTKQITKPTQVKPLTIPQKLDGQQPTPAENLQQLLSLAASALPKSTTQISIPVNAKISVPKQAVPSQTHVSQIQQQITVPKQVQVQSNPNVTATAVAGATGTHQISIPTSVLFGARPGSVVLATPTGKSYMIPATGGSIVLQPQGASSVPITTVSTTSGVSQTSPSLAVRTLQGIRVIPVSSAMGSHRTPTPLIAQSHVTNAQNQSGSNVVPAHHVVARIITTGQPGRGGVPQTQIVIPSTSALQPLLLAQAQQVTTASNQTIQTPLQVTSTPILSQTQVSLPLQHIKSSVASVELNSQQLPPK